MPIKRSSGRLPPVNTRKTYESPVISPPIIKHCTFPVVPKFSSLSFLLLSLILCVISTIIQYVNLYKTVWWLPNSSIEYAIEFDLIDYHGLAHILFMLCTPYLYFMLIKIIPSFILTSFVISSILGFFIFAIWSYVMLWIVNRIQYSGVTILHNISGVLLLTYFPALTLLTYHFRYLEKAVSRCTRRQQQYYHSTANNVNNNHQKTLSRSSFVSLKGFLQIISSCLRRSIAIFTDWPCLSSKNIFFPLSYSSVSSFRILKDNSLIQTAYYTMDLNSNNLVLLSHQCLGATPEQIRDEVELHRCDFNARLTDILIGTGHAVYYGCFLPIIFVQKEHLYIDYLWCLQHCLLTALLVFLLRWHYLLPYDYIDLLHRISMHLGSWESVLIRSGLTHTTVWSASVVYPCGAIVKHMRGLFRSVGINNCAEPGSALHSRFYSIFNNPQRISSILLCLSSSIILYQCAAAYLMVEWYKLIGLVINGLFCFINFYLHLRNSILMQFVYSKERDSSSSSSPPTSTAYCCLSQMPASTSTVGSGMSSVPSFIHSSNVIPSSHTGVNMNVVSATMTNE